MRYELSDYEWTSIKPMLPNKGRGGVRLSRVLLLACRNDFEQLVGKRTLEFKRLHDRRGSPLLRCTSTALRRVRLARAPRPTECASGCNSNQFAALLFTSGFAQARGFIRRE